VTRAKIGGADDPSLSPEERAMLTEWASAMGFATLHRLWQLLLKGHGEVTTAALPRETAEMALLRVVHASQLPDPGELARRLQSGEAVQVPLVPMISAAPAEPQAPLLNLPADFRGLIAMVDEGGKAQLAQQLHDFVGLVAYAPPHLALKALKPLPQEFARDLAAVLRRVTNAVWDVTMTDGDAAPSLLEQERAVEAAARDAILGAPLVAAARAAFPDAELIEEVRSSMR